VITCKKKYSTENDPGRRAASPEQHGKIPYRKKFFPNCKKKGRKTVFLPFQPIQLLAI